MYVTGIHNMYTSGEQFKYTLTSLYEITLQRKMAIFPRSLTSYRIYLAIYVN